jgi:Arc/MetJ-type ribon-helix-helix transcriptional regulator
MRAHRAGGEVRSDADGRGRLITCAPEERIDGAGWLGLAYSAAMGVIQVQLPEPLQQAIDREIAQGRVASRSEFLVEAARRFAEDLALEHEIVSEAKTGIADAESGRFVTISTPEDKATLHQRTMARLQSRLADDGS